MIPNPSLGSKWTCRLCDSFLAGFFHLDLKRPMMEPLGEANIRFVFVPSLPSVFTP